MDFILIFDAVFADDSPTDGSKTPKQDFSIVIFTKSAKTNLKNPEVINDGV